VVKVSAPPRRIFALAEPLVPGGVGFSMRPRTRDAVVAFVVQIGLRAASTSSVPMVSTGLSFNGAA